MTLWSTLVWNFPAVSAWRVYALQTLALHQAQQATVTLRRPEIKARLDPGITVELDFDNR